MKTIQRCLIAVCSGYLLYISPLAATEIYRYVDEEGQLHLSNKPFDEPQARKKTIHIYQYTAPTENNTASIEIYKYIDPDGVVHFADHQQDARYQLAYVGHNTHQKQYRKAKGKLTREYQQLVTQAASLNRLEPSLLYAVIKAESAYNPNATSVKGAAGLMQLMPDTAERYGVVDRYDPADNIQGGARYLRDLLALFNNNMELAVAAYNAGENAVIRYGNQIPPYAETKYYVSRVMSLYQAYKSL
jgi:hypothetical protein